MSCTLLSGCRRRYRKALIIITKLSPLLKKSYCSLFFHLHVPHEYFRTVLMHVPHEYFRTVLMHVPHEHFRTVLMRAPHEYFITVLMHVPHEHFKTVLMHVPHEYFRTVLIKSYTEPQMALSLHPHHCLLFLIYFATFFSDKISKLKLNCASTPCRLPHFLL